MSQYKRNNNELIKEAAIEYLGGKQCVVCGNNSLPLVCYDFHHKNGNKDEDISKMISRKTKIDDELKKELDKCCIACANCHRMITAGLQSLYE